MDFKKLAPIEGKKLARMDALDSHLDLVLALAKPIQLVDTFIASPLHESTVEVLEATVQDLDALSQTDTEACLSNASDMD